MLVPATDLHAIWQVVWVSVLAGVGVSALFSFVIVSAARAGDARRDGKDRKAASFTALAVLSFVVFAVGVVLGMRVLLTK
jgi:hypothetical protein